MHLFNVIQEVFPGFVDVMATPTLMNLVSVTIFLVVIHQVPPLKFLFAFTAIVLKLLRMELVEMALGVILSVERFETHRTGVIFERKVPEYLCERLS